MESKRLFGRKEIVIDIEHVNSSNIEAVMGDIESQIMAKAEEIDYLYNYYNGKQPILEKTKTIRPEINNKIVENNAKWIADFKASYLLFEPIQYISRKNEKDITDKLTKFNDFLLSLNKSALDKELATWLCICGEAYRMVLPSDGDVPFQLYTLDPRNTFVVYSNDYRKKPLLSGVVRVTAKGDKYYDMYTDDLFIRTKGSKIIDVQPNMYKTSPIIRYGANLSNMGSFEPVITMLDALNNLNSNRLDAVEGFVQALLVLKGVTATQEEIDEMIYRLGLKIPVDADANYLTQELNQTQTQTLVDYLEQRVLEICCIPNRNGGSSTSDTGVAVICRDGWQAAGVVAKEMEEMFKIGEGATIKLMLKFMREIEGTNLKFADIETKFTRRNYEDISSKAQVLATLLGTGAIHPLLAIQRSELFTDPELAYKLCKEYQEEQERKLADSLAKENGIDVQTD